MPGVLLIETMAQTSGWLIIAATKFHPHAVLRRVQGSKAALVRHARADALAVGEAAARRLGLRGHPGRDPTATASSSAMPRSPSGWSNSQARNSAPTWRRWRRSSNSRWSAGRWLTRRAKPGSPASASSPASAKAPTRIGRRCSPAPSTSIPRAFAPYIVHPLAPINLDKQIPKKGDQRQMEPWQRIGTYAAGLALDERRRSRAMRTSSHART